MVQAAQPLDVERRAIARAVLPRAAQLSLTSHGWEATFFRDIRCRAEVCIQPFNRSKQLSDRLEGSFSQGICDRFT